ncbi:M64 family metallopeptidase [Spartinivicinus poritis]|uniref:M64 family metallo-endopeptidase n=1 Tax=Spartinivicinus poritis TaxID=2994640 RepID=A0ABT5U749_9GAMM|nr:M64 family metallopeptidase [Spartinivicinus sp. A2-2]MDE1462199.1 M64 family metallo-endopeptidase [Spartinivicinus sp. A2-2]
MKAMTKGLVTLLLFYCVTLAGHAKLVEFVLTNQELLLDRDSQPYNDYLSQLNKQLGQPQSINTLAIIQLNSHNQTVKIEQLTSPLVLRGEMFNPQTGLIESVTNQPLATGNLYLDIDENEGINKILIFSPKTMPETGLTWQFSTERNVALTNIGIKEKIGESVFKLVDNGPSSNRVDLVFVAEGYTQNEIARFKEDLTAVVNGFFEEHPISLYKSYFNVWGVESISNQSGAGYSYPKDTRFKSYFNCYNIDRLLCVDISEVQKYVSQRLSSHSRDIIVVVVNTDKYGGSGGAVATMSLHSSAVDLALHEVAHTFGLLADEYDYGSCRVAPASEANVTNNRSGNKWSHWFDVANNVNVFEGAKYCRYGMYRPTNNSLMRALGQPFYAVNSEQLIRRIYSFTTPLSSQTPNTKTINISTQQQQAFSASLLQPTTKTVTAKWQLNDKQVSSATDFTFMGNNYPPGTYQLTVEAQDKTKHVIVDRNNRLKDAFTWTINLKAGSHQCHTPASPTHLTAQILDKNTFQLSWLAPEHAQHYTVQRLIEGTWQDEVSTTATMTEISNLAPESEQLVRVIGANGCDEMGKASEPLEVSLKRTLNF